MTDEAVLGAVADRLGERFGAFYSDLVELATRTREDLEAAIAPGARVGRMTAATSAAMREASVWFLTEHDLALGAGVIFSAERMEPGGRLIEWWMHGHDGTIGPVTFNHRPDDTDYYDFQRLPWFSIARDTRAPAIAGPYIDINGVDDYILTFTSPLELHREFYGVVGCDVRIGAIEQLVMPDLRRVSGDIALTHDDRIITGNSSRYLAGELLTVRPEEHDVYDVPLPVGGLRLVHRARG